MNIQQFIRKYNERHVNDFHLFLSRETIFSGIGRKAENHLEQIFHFQMCLAKEYMNLVKCLLLFIQPVWKVSFEIPEKFSIKSVETECFELNIFNQCKRE